MALKISMTMCKTEIRHEVVWAPYGSVKRFITLTPCTPVVSLMVFHELLDITYKTGLYGRRRIMAKTATNSCNESTLLKNIDKTSSQIL